MFTQTRLAFPKRAFVVFAGRDARDAPHLSIRRSLKISERVAIGLAVEAELGNRRGQRTDLASELRLNLDEVTGRSDAIAAKKAGFESRRSYRDARTVVQQGTPELVEAMDSGRLLVQNFAQVESGQRTDLASGELPQNFAEAKGKETREIAADKAGFGNAASAA